MSDEELREILPNIPPGADFDAVVDTLRGMDKKTRREWFVKMRMSSRRTTFAQMAKRHKITAWYLCGAVGGRYGWNKKIVKCLEQELDVNLGVFLLDKERKD